MTTLAYVFLGSFLTASLALQWWQQPAYPWWLWCTLLLCTVLLRTWRHTFAIALGITIAILCIMRTTHVSTINTVESYADGARWTIEGTISAEPDRRPLHTKYTIHTDSVADASGTILRGIAGNVLVSDYANWPRYEYGDRIRASGTLEKPEAIEEFRYDHYLSRYDTYAVMYRGSVTRIQSAKPSMRNMLYATKTAVENRINQLFPEPHASFMAGLLTGSRKGIPDNVMTDFNATGLTHIIAISGYNITIIISIIAAMLYWLPPQKRLLPAIAAICIFSLFVGASAAVVRAAIMGILGILALHTGRLIDVRLSVLWTAFFMVAWNPKVLWYDAGFQLSFLAVIGLVELGPMLEPLVRKLPETLGIRESMQMTLAAQLTAVPLVIVLFGRVSLIAPLANMLVAPAIPIAMLFGSVAIVASYLSITLGRLIAMFGWECMEWILLVARICANIPFASISIHIPVWTLIPYYVLLASTRYTTLRFWYLKAMARAYFSRASFPET